MIVVGLTGSVGMGKSTTAKAFEAEGVPVFDSDAVVHRLYCGEAVPLIEDVFPGVVRGGVVDRNALAAQVAGDDAAMKRLESVVHPLVRRERDAFVADARGRQTPLVVLDIPLLFETGSDAQVDAIVVVSAPESVQKARVLGRPGMTQARFAAILARQMPDAEKRRRAHFVIETDKGLDHAARQVRDVVEALTAG